MWYKARLDRIYRCGNYKTLDYYLQQVSREAALHHIQELYPNWRLLALRESPPPQPIEAAEVQS